MEGDESLKAALYDYCLEYVGSRLNLIHSAIRSARESANDDNKSSAGDKHETGRSMAQLEQEKLSVQLQEAEKLKQALEYIKRGKISSVISMGSLVFTDKGNYFIAISAGKVLIGDENYFLVSPASPVGSALMQGKTGQAFIFNGQTYRIKKAC
jgi:transcription elongation GreA/GreB family factor